MRSNERMAATLRRALETAATGEDKRLRDLVKEIQMLALATRATPPSENDFFELAGAASAVGEGSIAVAFVHQVLRE